VRFARASGLSRHRAEDLLRALELRGVLGHFGHVLIPGHGGNAGEPHHPGCGVCSGEYRDGTAGLFFIEMDMATERIVTRISHDRQTVKSAA
jgi:hypothetical protein